MNNWWRNFRRKRFYRRLFSDNSVHRVFDIGANEGVKSSLFLSLGAKVIAVEPLPDCVQQLNRLASQFPRLSVVEAAVSTEVGTTRLKVGTHNEISTLSEKMVTAYTVPGKVGWESELEVSTTTLNELFSRFGQPDFLKLDCEGYDHALLQTLHEPLQLIEFEFLQHFTQEAVSSIHRLNALADYTFNFSPFESGKWAFSTWTDANTLCVWLERNASVCIHGNIFAQRQSQS